MNTNNIPAAAMAAMDQAAKAFWAYPNAEWQDAFLAQWMQTNETLGELEAESPEGFRNTGWATVEA